MAKKEATKPAAKSAAKKPAAKKAAAKKPVAKKAAAKKEPFARNQEVEIPIFGTTVKAIFVMDRGGKCLFRSYDNLVLIQVPSDIVPK